MPYPGFRKITITLSIVVIVAYPSCGFILHRKTTAETVAGPTTDLASQESLQVKSIKRPNGIQSKDADINKETKNKYKFTSDMKFIDSTEDSTLYDAEKTESPLDTTVTDIITTLDVTLKEKGKSKVIDPSAVLDKTTHDTQTTASATTAKITATSNESLKHIKKHTFEARLTNISEAPATTDIQLIEDDKLKTEQKNITTTSIDNIHEGEVSSTIYVPTENDQIAIDSEATENLTADKNPISNITMKIIKETENNVTETSINKSITLIASSKNLATKEDTSSNNMELELSKSLDEKSKSASTVVEVKITKDSSIITTEPSWKIYSTIERKRSSQEIVSSTEKEQDLAKAESMMTTLPIQSLEMLREELLSTANHLPSVSMSQTKSGTTETESTPTLESIDSFQSENLGTVASKRAGFLDLTKSTFAHYEKTSTEKNTDYRTMYDIEAADIEAQEIKKVNGYESQSQLAEDAMKEELMKEEIISNREENAVRYDDAKVEGKQLLDSTKSADSTKSQVLTEDNLSVQPIHQDRRTTLYTVGPNYKPMKRIDVQPAKSLVRDPDDNSWRNESISSLGIVFKPKNSSSKSFKEVLKTKTETELNNTQDKDSKSDTPELRERLEKIAEVRKSKKKRIDKFGEVVYTDYEEGSSAEGTSTTQPDATTTKHSELPPKEPETEVTSPMTTTVHNLYWKNKLETINKEEMLKDLGLDTLTTEKPKKLYTLSEYYDATDEYDADYLNLSKIDLKKFVASFKPTFPTQTSPSIPMPTTRLMATQFPDRRPTVQYFPPTTKPQKVNVNDYDVNFERRVQLYTMKETPKTMSPFVRIPAASGQPEIQPTVKPSGLSTYTRPLPSRLPEPRVTEPQNFAINDGNFNRGTYIIKHYKDFLNDAARGEDDERTSDFVSYTEAPNRGVTLDEQARAIDKGKTADIDYEYDSQFRKDVLNRFVDNFNQNSDRFKVDFPVLFNTSVVHRDDQSRVLASSSTFMKRLYGNEPTATKAPDNSRMNKDCEPNCDITVELSPEYELHYYVPEQEEREEAVQRPATLPYRYKL